MGNVEAYVVMIVFIYIFLLVGYGIYLAHTINKTPTNSSTAKTTALPSYYITYPSTTFMPIATTTLTTTTNTTTTSTTIKPRKYYKVTYLASSNIYGVKINGVILNYTNPYSWYYSGNYPIQVVGGYTYSKFLGYTSSGSLYISPSNSIISIYGDGSIGVLQCVDVKYC
jgi:hypothetical protein